METNQIDVAAFTVFSYPKQIDDAQETRLSRQFRSDIRETDRLDRIHFNISFLHAISRVYSNVRASPDSHAASDFSATNSLAKTLGETMKRVYIRRRMEVVHRYD